MFSLYSDKVLENSKVASEEDLRARFSHLSNKVKSFLEYLNKNKIISFTPVEMAKPLAVTNRTIINWSTELCANGFLEPVLVKQRIRSYRLV